jgi:hypothetical protein
MEGRRGWKRLPPLFVFREMNGAPRYIHRHQGLSGRQLTIVASHTKLAEEVKAATSPRFPFLWLAPNQFLGDGFPV